MQEMKCVSSISLHGGGEQGSAKAGGNGAEAHASFLYLRQEGSC